MQSAFHWSALFCACYVRLLEFAVHELLLPDIAMVHGRFIVSAWEFGLEGVQDAAVKLLSLAVEVVIDCVIAEMITVSGSTFCRLDEICTESDSC